MADLKTYRTLTFKLMAVVCAALAVAVVTFLGTQLLGNALVEEVYLSEEAVQTRLNKEISSFRTYVAEEQVNSTDVKAVGLWNREHPEVQLTITGLTTIMNSSANGVELVGNESGWVIRASGDTSSITEFPVNFRDGVFTVEISDISQGRYLAAANLAAISLAALIFLAIVLLYDQHVTRTIQTLSRQVRQVSRGDLQMQIQPMSHDEIGQLVLDVDTMRLSIIDKLQREEAAWKANTQLITAISHDVRTPLTALMGYLEILSDDATTAEERKAYLEICKNNANRLKGLTDELFGFFLVFGKPTPDQILEELDAATLLEQILLEHEMNLQQKGFSVQTTYESELRGKLRVDVGHLRRVFDNLFSNVNKYADRDRPVQIRLDVVDEELEITITNSIPRHVERVESNRIGLQTCQKLIAAMGGEFHQHRTKESFSAEVYLPLILAEE